MCTFSINLNPSLLLYISTFRTLAKFHIFLTACFTDQHFVYVIHSLGFNMHESPLAALSPCKQCTESIQHYLINGVCKQLITPPTQPAL